ncbi:ribokinase [Salinicoccus roseus]|uniref:ribokinase n=1 Tax=Salinicoccus roseus TaxID=45670 RepID=UPI001CA68896|nr:ribokinase [Salinicoccus roseus]MBY8909931.1 ribokinase [Salinicoccus roseus]
MDLVVVGSLSTDFIVQADRMPEKGETLIGHGFSTAFGGKGANQAVAAARLETKTAFIGAVGDDTFGEKLKSNLKYNNIFCDDVETFTGVSSGTAHINIYDNDNSIIVVPGSNGLLTPEVLEKHLRVIEQAEYVLVQNEIPVETIEYVINHCHQKGVKVIYNPAPYIDIDISTLEKCHLVTPNEIECMSLFNLEPSKAVAKYPKKLIVTMGDKGCLYHNGHQEVLVPSFNAEPVDTTGAGDTFNGALAAFLTKGKTLEKAMLNANLAASLSIRKMGAQGGIPTLKECKEAVQNVQGSRIE